MKIVRALRHVVARLLPRRSVLREIERTKRLISMVEATEDQEIACEETSRLLDEYADLVIRGEDAGALMPAVRHHLSMCMDCRQEYEALLIALGGRPDEQ